MYRFVFSEELNQCLYNYRLVFRHHKSQFTRLPFLTECKSSCTQLPFVTERKFPCAQFPFLSEHKSPYTQLPFLTEYKSPCTQLPFLTERRSPCTQLLASIPGLPPHAQRNTQQKIAKRLEGLVRNITGDRRGIYGGIDAWRRGTSFSRYQAFLTLHFWQIVEAKIKTMGFWVRQRPIQSTYC